MRILAFYLALLGFISAMPSEAAPKKKAEILPVVMGSVKSTEGRPLDAVIKVKKGRQKARTDERGNFVLQGVPADAHLVIAFHGVKTEIAVDGREKIRLTLVDPIAQMKGGSGANSVDTVMGKISKDNYSGSMSELTADEIEKGGFNSLIDAVRTKIGGVTVTDDGQVTMRGINTINGSIYALVIIDGVEADSILDVDVRDVASLSILREGDMYGLKGANGVVLITTKR